MDYFKNTFYFAFSAVLLVFSLYIVIILSVAGTMFNQLLNFNRVWDYMTDHCSKHKTYRLLSPFRSEVYTSDPANVEYILKTNFQNYGKGSYNYNNLKDLLGDGIFAVDGDKWRHQRKIYMCGSSDEGTLFARAFDNSSEMTAWRYVDASWTIKRFLLNIGSEAKLKKNVKVIDEFVYKLIHTKIDQMSSSPNDASVSF
ncbi:hypothetical protein MKW92_039576 [Papaver armeniacum]|nr:hypothetical protein MKW92_039576 [Papaver armeniacum]